MTGTGPAAVLILTIVGVAFGVRTYLMRLGGYYRPIEIGREETYRHEVIFPRQQYSDILKIPGIHDDLYFGQEFEILADPTGVVISMQRLGLQRPNYTAIIHGDGAIDFLNASGGLPDRHGRVPKDDVVRLIDKIRQADYFSLRDRYIGGPTDGYLAVITVDVGGLTKTVIDSQGEFGGMPDTLPPIEDEIDRTANVNKWLSGGD